MLQTKLRIIKITIHIHLFIFQFSPEHDVFFPLPLQSHIKSNDYQYLRTSFFQLIYYNFICTFILKRAHFENSSPKGKQSQRKQGILNS